jgi:hypothetical protein
MWTIHEQAQQRWYPTKEKSKPTTETRRRGERPNHPTYYPQDLLALQRFFFGFPRVPFVAGACTEHSEWLMVLGFLLLFLRFLLSSVFQGFGFGCGYAALYLRVSVLGFRFLSVLRALGGERFLIAVA